MRERVLPSEPTTSGKLTSCEKTREARTIRTKVSTFTTLTVVAVPRTEAVVLQVPWFLRPTRSSPGDAEEEDDGDSRSAREGDEPPVPQPEEQGIPQAVEDDVERGLLPGPDQPRVVDVEEHHRAPEDDIQRRRGRAGARPRALPAAGRPTADGRRTSRSRRRRERRPSS